MTSTNEEQAGLLRDSEAGLDDDYNPRKKIDRASRQKLCRALIYSAFGFFCIFLIAAIFSSLHSHKSSKSKFPCLDTHKGYTCYNPISHSWGQYSPFHLIHSSIPPNPLPPTCRLNFAQILSRHGARDPTLHKSTSYAQLISKIQSLVPLSALKGPYAFLANYTYSLGSDQLTDFGRQQMFDSGYDFYTSYRPLTETTTPFIRASGQTRVVESAEKFAEGFQHALLTATSDDENSEDKPPPILTIPESPTQNSTLSRNAQCPAFRPPPLPAEQQSYLQTFLPRIRTRLLTALPSSNLTLSETLDLMSLCPFTTVALPPQTSTSTTSTLPPICSLFHPQEWTNYARAASLGKYYTHGPGARLGPTQGVGWVNELIARLTRSPVEDSTSTNRTLDAPPSVPDDEEEGWDSVTFPLKRGLYADFTHDNEMISIFAAMGLYDDGILVKEGGLPEGYDVGALVPFAGRMVVEGMECGDGGGEARRGERMVRVIMNGRVLPLRMCGSDEQRRCSLEAFVSGLKFAREGGRWDECFEEPGD